MKSHSAIFGPLLFVLCLAPSVAHAQGAEANRVAARTLGFEANAALAKKDYAAAAESFARAEALFHAPTLLLGLARADVGLGKLAAARELYVRIVREGVSPGSPAAFSRAVADAQVELAALELRMPPVLVAEKAAPDSGTTSEPPSAPVPPPSAAPTTVPGATLVPTPSKSAVLAPLAAATPRSVSPPSAPSVSLERSLGFAALGLGGAGLVVGVVTGILALDMESELSAVCPDTRCPPREQATIDAYSSLRIAAGATLIAGAVLAATGSLLILTTPRPRSQGAFVRPAIGAGFFFLKGAF